MKRNVDIAILSDLHLGNYSCHSRELLQYLHSIQPRTLILNGDIFDSSFQYNSFPRQHMEVVHQFVELALNGTKVFYITGNSDDHFRRFSNLSMGTIHLRDKLVLQINKEKYWIFHGDVLDAAYWVSPTLRFFGRKGYHLLIRINRWNNLLRSRLGKGRQSYAGKIKNSFTKARKYIEKFENKAIELAAAQGYNNVICGHIHQPIVKTVATDGTPVTYMNSGDWVENLTALEYRMGSWEIYQFDPLDYTLPNPRLNITKKSQGPDQSARDLLTQILESNDRGEDEIFEEDSHN